MNNRSKVGRNTPASRGRLQSSRKKVIYERPYARPQGAGGGGTGLSQTTALTVAQLSRKIVQSKGVVRAARSAKERPDLPRQSRSKVLKRHSVKPAKNAYRPKYRRPLRHTVVTSMAVLTFLLGVAVATYSFKASREMEKQVQVLAATNAEKNSTEGLPSEDNSAIDLNSYSVDSDLPRLLFIEKLGVNSRVQALGAGVHNSLAAPPNIFDVAWYDASSKPGEEGAVVINGHVSGPTKPAVFHDLRSLKEGDKIMIERGDGKKFTYSVIGSQLYENDKVDMAKLMASSQSGKPGLNLITSTGRFNVRTNQFEQRVVIFAVQD